MKKAIVLTYAKITDEEKELIKNSGIFKIACNNYCADLKPNVRLCADDIVQKCLDCDTCPVISLNYGWGTDKRVIEAGYLPKRHSSLISCIDYLFLKGFTHILLVANNLQATGRDIKEDMQKINLNGVNSLKDYLYLYKYSDNGIFDIPTRKVKDFIMEELLTDEEKILGVEEPARRLLNAIVLTDACLYEVHTENLNNVSVENGELVKTILSVEDRVKLMKGEKEINYNGLIIRRITQLETDQSEEYVTPEGLVITAQDTTNEPEEEKQEEATDEENSEVAEETSETESTEEEKQEVSVEEMITKAPENTEKKATAKTTKKTTAKGKSKSKKASKK